MFFPALLALAAITLPDDAGAQRAQLPDGLAPGQAFPTVALPALDGDHPMSVADFRGRKVILHVFASW
jgi:hypothetical protein